MSLIGIVTILVPSIAPVKFEIRIIEAGNIKSINEQIKKMILCWLLVIFKKLKIYTLLVFLE